MSQSWKSLLSRQERAIERCKDLLAQKSKLQREGKDASEVAQSAAAAVRQLAQGIEDLDDFLRDLDADSGARITSGELKRRQAIVTRLDRTVKELTERSRRSAYSDMHELTAGADGAAAPQVAAMAQMSDSELQQQTIDRQHEQDQALDGIHQGIGRVKENALLISDELDLQKGLLDDVGDEIDRGRRNLKKETRRAKFAGDKAKGVCWMYIVIMLLFLVLVALVLYRWH